MTTMRSASGLLIVALASGCAGAIAPSPGPQRVASAPVAPGPTRPAGHGDAALEDLRAHMATGDAQALLFADIRLAGADGAREMTGDNAPDEHVERTVVVSHPGDVAAVLVVTTCGNASIASGRWDGTRWLPVTRVPLIRDLHPGRCGTVDVRAQPLRLSSDAPREIGVVFVMEDATGESVNGPFLSVFQLETDGGLATLMARASFGAMDDTTGATTNGEFLVVDDVPAPRDLHVAIRPGRPGPGGAPAPEIVRRRYALRGSHLELVEEHAEEAE